MDAFSVGVEYMVYSIGFILVILCVCVCETVNAVVCRLDLFAMCKVQATVQCGCSPLLHIFGGRGMMARFWVLRSCLYR